jgi:hypothetical protein
MTIIQTGTHRLSKGGDMKKLVVAWLLAALPALAQPQAK